ncbi:MULTISPECIES: hypothetical protein [unclassified Fusibacter]|uniref:hypothetical protein n=1 Tax=unclassified Fusibacter TaxID=2624464 RepID=UPI0010100B8D|nr:MULTISPECIES: hypothetical protein [unclassified Fusibacter]MCK8058534.1 hypothetical protein [Fusibacter sp. A2]NPE22697.1 hypothetical protein [Fusibacter sp. A1]RXV60257.1 hypothetical protein DWB64_12665 [Fusibacter sp. A1]
MAQDIKLASFMEYLVCKYGVVHMDWAFDKYRELAAVDFSDRELALRVKEINRTNRTFLTTGNFVYESSVKNVALFSRGIAKRGDCERDEPSMVEWKGFKSSGLGYWADGYEPLVEALAELVDDMRIDSRRLTDHLLSIYQVEGDKQGIVNAIGQVTSLKSEDEVRLFLSRFLQVFKKMPKWLNLGAVMNSRGDSDLEPDVIKLRKNRPMQEGKTLNDCLNELTDLELQRIGSRRGIRGVDNLKRAERLEVLHTDILSKLPEHCHYMIDGHIKCFNALVKNRLREHVCPFVEDLIDLGFCFELIEKDKACLYVPHEVAEVIKAQMNERVIRQIGFNTRIARMIEFAVYKFGVISIYDLDKWIKSVLMDEYRISTLFALLPVTNVGHDFQSARIYHPGIESTFIEIYQRIKNNSTFEEYSKFDSEEFEAFCDGYVWSFHPELEKVEHELSMLLPDGERMDLFMFEMMKCFSLGQSIKSITKSLSEGDTNTCLIDKDKLLPLIEYCDNHCPLWLHKGHVKERPRLRLV